MNAETVDQPTQDASEATPGTNVLDEIFTWAAKDLRYWEQAALDQIVAGATIDDDAFERLLAYLLEDAGLAEKTGTRPELAILKRAPASAAKSAGRPKQLVSLSGLRFINALASNQALTFGPGMTAIFGANGSGKSGYARVLASAAFTRGDKDVLKDVTKPDLSSEVMSAEFQLDDGSGPKTYHYRVGDGFAEMQSFYVFDSTSVYAHLGGANEVSFSPAGLGYLTILAKVTDSVRQRLQAKIQARSRPNPFPDIFQGTSPVSTALAELDAGTDLKPFQELKEVTPKEEKSIGTLDKRIAELKNEKIPEKLKAMAVEAADIKRLRESLQGLEKAFNQDAIDRVNSLVTRYTALKEAADAQSLEPFKVESLTQTGSDPWFDFVKAARFLANEESVDEQAYPKEDSRCLLCLQPLSPEARTMLAMLWRFLESDAQKNLQLLEEQIEKEAIKLERINTGLLPEDSAVYRTVERLDAEFLKTAKAELTTLQERQKTLVTALRAKTEVTLELKPLTSAGALEALEKKITEGREELSKKNSEEEVNKLLQQKRELEHRIELGKRWAEVEAYIADCKWVKKANSPSVKRSSRRITDKSNGLFDALVTQKYIDLFQEKLNALNCPLKVEIQTKPSKGKTLKQLRLKTHPDFQGGKARTETVLSEGEQRAVAIAGR